jgi:hypothetical protein
MIRPEEEFFLRRLIKENQTKDEDCKQPRQSQYADGDKQ